MPGVVTDMGSGVYFVGGPAVNWVLIRDGDAVTMIDAGYPKHVGLVEQSVRDIGSRPEDVRVILLTHAHIDHIGAVNHFHRAYGTPTWLADAEIGFARRERIEGATAATVAAQIWRPGMVGWTVRLLRAGGHSRMAVAHGVGFPGSGPLDVPGRPEPIVTAGHTSGHTAFYLPGIGAVATGDALITGHPVSRMVGPQVIPTMFNHCGTDRVVAALDGLVGLDAGIVLPGHGDPYHGPIAEAVAAARESSRDHDYW